MLAHLRELHLPELPSVDELRSRIAEQYSDSPSLDEIAERAREIILDKVFLHMSPELRLGMA